MDGSIRYPGQKNPQINRAIDYTMEQIDSRFKERDLEPLSEAERNAVQIGVMKGIEAVALANAGLGLRIRVR